MGFNSAFKGLNITILYFCLNYSALKLNLLCSIWYDIFNCYWVATL